MAQAPHEPTPQLRRQAEALAGYGLPQRMICRIIGVSEPTLRAYYTEELHDGEAKATAKVAQTLFQRATEGHDLGACIFWLKARAGWRERQVIEHAQGLTLEQLISQSRRPIETIEHQEDGHG